MAISDSDSNFFTFYKLNFSSSLSLIHIYGVGDYASEHLIQRGILYKLLADLIVELKTADHIGGGQLLFRDKIAFQLFRYGEAQMCIRDRLY